MPTLYLINFLAVFKKVVVWLRKIRVMDSAFW
jgi:hypothetical protein